MSFRDDRDAMLAQIDALRHELEDTQERLAAAEAAIADADGQVTQSRSSETSLLSALDVVRAENRRLRAELELLRAVDEPAFDTRSYLQPPEMPEEPRDPGPPPEPTPERRWAAAAEPLEFPEARIGSYLKPPDEE